MTKHKYMLQLSDVPVEKIDAPEGSAFGGQRQRVGAPIGARKLGYSFSMFHREGGVSLSHPYRHEEMIYIIGGERILRFGSEEIALTAGTVIACPPGDEHPHQVINTAPAELRYLVVSTMEYPDLSEYPDSNKVGAYSSPAVGPNVGFRALYVKDKNANYYDGEDGKEIERIIKSARRDT
ncbi:MAG: cupin domain-containing protein [Candidatus Binatia bacterium]